MTPHKQLTLAILLLLSFYSYSQRDSTGNDVTDVFKLTFINPGISYEKRIAKYQTLSCQAFMNTSAEIQITSNGQNDYSNFYFDPAFTLQYRYYYNIAKRDEYGKRTQKNSANYIAVIYECVFSKIRLSTSYLPEKDRRPINKIGAAWGIQRNYTKKFSLDLNIGLGYFIAKSTELDIYGNGTSKNAGQINILGQLNIGFWLGRNK